MNPPPARKYPMPAEAPARLPEQHLPVIGISCGDLNGVGLETILKVLADTRVSHLCIPVLFASEKVVDFYNEKRSVEERATFRVIRSLEALSAGHNYLFTAWNEEVSLQPGVLTEAAGKYAVRSLQVAAQCLKDGQINGLVTAPIHKANTHSQHFPYTGHTPFLKDFFGSKEVLMLLHEEGLRIALATEHIPVSAISASLSTEKIMAKLTLLQATLVRDFGIDRPKMAVLALNPHAGDGGTIGGEEATILRPAIEMAQQTGMLAYGPFAADGFFARRSYEQFDGVLAMYHDQGLIPFKSLAQNGGVNYTGGLPVIRTSPDHGTAFDIAGQGIADAASLREAIFECINRIRQRHRYDKNTANPLPLSRLKRERSFGNNRPQE